MVERKDECWQHQLTQTLSAVEVLALHSDSLDRQKNQISHCIP